MKKCKHCQSEIDDKAKICPNCRKKQGIPTWIIVIGVIIVLGAIAGNGGNSTSPENNGNNSNSSNSKSETKVIEYQKIDIDTLEADLKNNAAAAKDTYNGKYLEITGRLGTIDSDLKYISLLSNTDDWDLIGVHCSIKNSATKDIVKTLTRGQTIIVKGKITDVGEVLGYYLDINEIVTE